MRACSGQKASAAAAAAAAEFDAAAGELDSYLREARRLWNGLEADMKVAFSRLSEHSHTTRGVEHAASLRPSRARAHRLACVHKLPSFRPRMHLGARPIAPTPQHILAIRKLAFIVTVLGCLLAGVAIGRCALVACFRAHSESCPGVPLRSGCG